jgi:fucose permease
MDIPRCHLLNGHTRPFFFYYLPLPEASNTDLQLQCDDLGISPSTPSILSPHLPLIYLTLALAVFAQFLYVAAQECMAAWFSILLTTLSTPYTSTPLTLSINNYTLVSLTTFAIARFIFGSLCLIFPPRILLLVTFCGGILVSALTTALHINVNALAAPALMFFFFEGPAWPLIFAIGLRGMGRNTKLAAAFLTASAGGGGLFPFAMWGVQNVSHKTVQYSFCVIVALFAFGAIFPLYLNLVPRARHQVDPANFIEPISRRATETQP